MSKQVYIHYGATVFDPTKNFPVKNLEEWMKPKGGLWASRKQASFGWKDWCREEEFRDCNIANSFEFIMEDESKIFTISRTDQLYSLPEIEKRRPWSLWYLIDFEKCIELGIDAIELCWYGDEYKDVAKGNLWDGLYGWDCDSIVVLNPNAVIPIKERKSICTC